MAPTIGPTGKLGDRHLHYQSAPSGTPGPPSRKRSPFRPDIEGLRAVAVLGVVLFHANVGILHGGYVGVDVFFVVSGYLITGLLWRELRKDRRISLPSFYARRARRLLPASILVVVVTIIASRIWLPPLELSSVAKDGIACALYFGNYRFALQQTNYLNATAPPSPFQHYWSLGVEEQFYLVWPLLLLAGSLVWRRRRARSGQPQGPDLWTAIALLAAVTVGSFVLSLWLTNANQPWAFFSLPSRAWELGAGGLLALASPLVESLPERAAGILGWGGLAAITGSFFLIGTKTPFPGVAALVPVLGTVATIAGGTAAGGPGRILGTSGPRLIGRISYSWYLWHWPFLILAPDVVGHPLNLAQNLLVALISGIVALVSFLVIESPARASSWLSAFARRSLLTGGSLSAGGAVACVLVAATVPSLAGHGRAPVAAIHQPSDPIAAHPPVSVDPRQAAIDAVNAQVQSQVAASLATTQVPANLQPSVSQAHLDEPAVFVDGCMDSFLDSIVRNCAFGDETSTTSVVLFGDSHAAMWFPAVDYAANQNGWKLYNWTKATCPPIDAPIWSPELGRNFTECETWRQNVLARIAQVHPALVVLAMARHYIAEYGFVPYQQTWNQGLSQMISSIVQLGSKVVVIGPVPKPPFNVPLCLSQNLSDAQKCQVSQSVGIDEAGEAVERQAAVQAGASYIRTEPWFCANGQCADIVGNIEVWRDDNHITGTYSKFLGPAMSAELAAILPPS
jgi:peptidoglycan/LPS O-acetylase OafA/YrhL